MTVLTIFLVGLGLSVRPVLMSSERDRSVQEILRLVRIRQPGALVLARQHVHRFPSDVFGLALAAEAAATQVDNEAAIHFLRQLPKDNGRWEFFAELSLGRRYESMGRISQAELHLRRALELMPHHLEANERLGHLLQVEGRVWEAAPHFFCQILRGKCRGDELLCAATVDRFWRSDPQLELVVGNGNGGTADVLLKLAVAREAIGDNRMQDAEQLLREIVSSRPNLGEAQGRLGRIIVERGDLSEFLHWRGGLPDDVRAHPEVWFAQGLKARQIGQIEGAIRCFLEVLLRSPAHLSASAQLATSLHQIGQSEVAQLFSRRAELLAEMEATLSEARSDADPKKFAKTVKMLEELGRWWEAAGWSYVMTRMDIPHEPPRREMRRLLGIAKRDPFGTQFAMPRIEKLRIEDFTPPRWPLPDSNSPKQTVTTAEKRNWDFVDDANRVGIQFQYFEGTQESNRLEHIFNVMGGGLGAIDYDCDGWPDLYFAQGNNWRGSSPQATYVDKLYRNMSGERFQDVTIAAHLGDLGFSHGVNVADFNTDGFPDIYLGNMGANCLYLNNGDGTFEEIAEHARVAGNEWTTSSAFADVNGDRNPDLYVLNYSPISEATRTECRHSDGTLKACHPSVLPAEHDKLFLNRGDGTFHDVSEVAGILAPDGRGLGVVVWDFTGDGRLDIFVANDTSANFFFVNQGQTIDGMPRFSEEAIVRGVAFDEDGHAQASMGVAAGDVNGDGNLDMYITTFAGETKTLHSQRSDGAFDDLTRPLNLRDSGYRMLGFGCQFADFDGDGWLDLVVTNGHVDRDLSGSNDERMMPQLFHNLQGKRFEEISQSLLGPFFTKRYLGRGLAVLDWNRDGREDVAISHIHSAAALVTNQTSSVGEPFVVRLIGNRSGREPIGASVRVRSGAREMVRMLTGGDGFLVANERVLRFSTDSKTNDIEVRWPAGGLQRYSSVPSRQQITLIEGVNQPILQPLP